MSDREQPEILSKTTDQPQTADMQLGAEPPAVKRMTHDVDTDDMFAQSGE